jgi:hypothetical protein
MVALSNNDTTEMACKAPYQLERCYLTTESLLITEIYSTRMGILGELPRKEMLAKLQVK